MEPFLGMLAVFPYRFPPAGWVECLGQSLSVREHMALFAVVGTQFGGDGQSTFNLPDLTDKGPAPGLKYFIAIEGLYPSHS